MVVVVPSWSEWIGQGSKQFSLDKALHQSGPDDSQRNALDCNRYHYPVLLKLLYHFKSNLQMVAVFWIFVLKSMFIAVLQ